MTSTLETQRDLRRRLINDVSHELNTPLSVIQLEAKGLRDGLQTPESASDHIIQEVERLRGLVTDLDWLAETDRGKLRLTLEATSIYELLTAEVDRWHPQAQTRQVELSLQASGDLPDMDLDRMRMSQATGKRPEQRHSLHRGWREYRTQGRVRRRQCVGYLDQPMTGSASMQQTFPTSSTASTVPTSLVVVG